MILSVWLNPFTAILARGKSNVRRFCLNMLDLQIIIFRYVFTRIVRTFLNHRGYSSGRIWGGSEMGKRSTFIITLPIRRLT